MLSLRLGYTPQRRRTCCDTGQRGRDTKLSQSQGAPQVNSPPDVDSSTMLRPAASLAAAQVRTQRAGGLLTQLLTSSPQRCAASDWLTQRTKFSSALHGVFLTQLKQTQLEDLCAFNYCTLKSLWQKITGPIQY